LLVRDVAANAEAMTEHLKELSTQVTMFDRGRHL